jgi:hypothetical protein
MKVAERSLWLLTKINRSLDLCICDPLSGQGQPLSRNKYVAEEWC